MRCLKGIFTCNREDMKWEISDRREESSLEGDSGPLLRVVEQKKVISNQIYLSLTHHLNCSVSASLSNCARVGSEMVR